MTRWTFGLLYGHVWLDRQGQWGQTDTLLTRLQWAYWGGGRDWAEELLHADLTVQRRNPQFS